MIPFCTKLAHSFAKFSLCQYGEHYSNDTMTICLCPGALADPGGRRGAHPPPQQDQFLSFSHTFSPKSVRVGGWCPPQREILDPPLQVYNDFTCACKAVYITKIIDLMSYYSKSKKELSKNTKYVNPRTNYFLELQTLKHCVTDFSI